jgi:hypothetical protein
MVSFTWPTSYVVFSAHVEECEVAGAEATVVGPARVAVVQHLDTTLEKMGEGIGGGYSRAAQRAKALPRRH